MTYLALFLVLTVFLILPIFLYRRSNKYVAWFCYHMSTSQNFRVFFCLNILIAVIYSHFIYFNAYGAEYGLILSTSIMIMMFNTKWVRAFFRHMIDSRRSLMAFTCLTLLTMFIPHLFTTSITFAILVVGLSFYPEDRILDADGEPIRSMYYSSLQSDDYKELVDEYFKTTYKGGEGLSIVNMFHCGLGVILCGQFINTVI